MARGRNGLTASLNRSDEVYTAALRLFKEKGYHATSMQDIAAAVGLYKGSLYHYISSKEDLLVRVFENAMGSLLSEAEQIAFDSSLPAAIQLRRLIEAHVCAVTSNLDALTVYLHEFRALAGSSLDRVRAQRERYSSIVASVIERGVRQGEFATPDVGIATLGLLGMCNWIVQWYQPDGRLAAPEIASQFADLITGGLSGTIDRAW